MLKICLCSPGTQYSFIQCSKFELSPTQKPLTKNRTPGLHSSIYGILQHNYASKYIHIIKFLFHGYVAQIYIWTKPMGALATWKATKYIYSEPKKDTTNITKVLWKLGYFKIKYHKSAATLLSFYMLSPRVFRGIYWAHKEF